MLSPSEKLFPEEEKQLAENIEKVVNQGRDKEISIITQNGEEKLTTWIGKILTEMQVIADAFDEYHGGNEYRSALTLMQGIATNPDFTLSAQIESDSRRLGGTWKLGSQLAKKHQEELANHALSNEDAFYFANLAIQSFADQQALEREDNRDFYDFIQAYR